MPVTLDDLEAARIDEENAKAATLAATARLNNSNPRNYMQTRVAQRALELQRIYDDKTRIRLELEAQYLRENPGGR